jgi:hypothetical protein
MTEQQYIDTTDLQRVRKNILREILPPNSKVVSQEDHNEVMRILSKWNDDLYEAIGEVTTDEE